MSVDNEDVVAFDGTDFSLFFDGSAHGLAGFAIDGVSVLEDGDILLSFTNAGSVPGISQTVDDSDIVRFDAATGGIEMFFDGSDVGLASSGEDVDGLELLPDGRLLVTVNNLFGVPGVRGNDEDVIVFTGTFGSSTSGSWEMYFDGADVSFNYSNEDIDALSVSGGSVFVSTIGNFSASGLNGSDEDIAECAGAQTGWSTSCSSITMFFDGSTWGVGGTDVTGIDVP